MYFFLKHLFRSTTIAGIIAVLILTGCGRFMSSNLREKPYIFDKQNEKKYSVTVFYVYQPRTTYAPIKTSYVDINTTETTWEKSTDNYNVMHINSKRYLYTFLEPPSEFINELEATGFFSEIHYTEFNGDICSIKNTNKQTLFEISVKKGSGVGWLFNDNFFKKCKTDYVLILGDVHNNHPLNSTGWSENEGQWDRNVDLLGCSYMPFSMLSLYVIPGSVKMKSYNDYAIFKKDESFIAEGEVRNNGRDYTSCTLSPFFLFANETYKQGDWNSGKYYITPRIMKVLGNITAKEVVDKLKGHNKN